MKNFSSENIKPLYEQLAQEIREQISKGVYQVGAKIPTEEELISKYGMSRITVRKAISILSTEGILEKKQGKGTFVLPLSDAQKKSGRTILSFEDRCKKLGRNPSYRVLEQSSVKANDYIRAKLGLPEGSRVVKVVRVLLADNRPAMYEISHFSMGYSYILEANLECNIYDVFKQYSVKPFDATYEININRSDIDTSKALNIQVGTPLMHLRENVYDFNGRPLHTTERFILENFVLEL